MPLAAVSSPLLGMDGSELPTLRLAGINTGAAMPTVTCRNCGRDLPDESPGADPTTRTPCPTCGSVSRSFKVDVGAGEVTLTGGTAELSVTRNLIDRWRHQRNAGTAVAVGSASGVATVAAVGSTAQLFPPTVSQDPPDILIAAEVLSFRGITPDGQLVEAVTLPWFEIVDHLATDPAFFSKVHWRKVEEIIAGAFERDGWPEVVLTPRSADKGRDVIATRPGVGSVRIVGQVKHYGAGHTVTAEEVSAIAFTRDLDKASKAMAMTTGRFAPGVLKDPRLQSHMPHQLELMDGPQLRAWLIRLRENH